jgi:predicted hotdog family 3-hydroxylacyl-ACP dehydratase
MNTFPPIEELLAHRGNMLLLKEVVGFTDTEVTCIALPDGAAWYAQDGAMPAWVGVELMAQAIAAHVALLARQKGLGPRPGVLLGTRNYQASCAAFPLGTSLTVRATESGRAGTGLASYNCAVLAPDSAPLANAILTVHEPANFEQFILGAQA